MRPSDSAIPPSSGGAGAGGTGGSAGSGGQAGTRGYGGSAGNGGAGGIIPTGGTGGIIPTGGAGGIIPIGGAGGIIPTGGTGGIRPTGGTTMTGGTTARGGSGGGGSGGGAGGAACASVTPCGGDVVGTWNVTSSCLTVAGQLDLSTLGLGCASAPVTGSLQVSGTWIARSDGTYSDHTTTSGSEQIALPASCANVAGTPVACERLAPLLLALGYGAVSCRSAASTGCTCLASVAQSGGAGSPSLAARTNGTYKVSDNVLTADGVGQYSYCVLGNGMVWSPQNASPTTTGTIAFQRAGGIGSGGATTIDGAAGAGGSTGLDGATSPGARPCDVYAAEDGPCVAAHSTVRRLSSTYTGPLYQVRVGGAKGGTGGVTTDIGFLADGFADSAAQDVACGGNACTISIIYDQSGLGNHLTVAPAGGAKRTPDNEANATALPVTIGGHNVYGVKISPGIGYRNNGAVGTATGDQPETMYMVASGDFYNGGCCFDYGNAETNSMDNGEGAAEAVYFGNCTIWNKGAGDGPWVMADLENGLWAGNVSPYEGNMPVTYKYVTGMVKGDSVSAARSSGHWTIKVGDAQSGLLTTPFDGPRPSTRYVPMKKEGAIILGIAGDNSNGAQGGFFEGLMTAHYSSNEADTAVQASIVAAYGP